jgi:hypothetical protein
VLHAEQGDTAAAEVLFSKARACYGAVSPFPLVMLDFQRGVMWMEAGDPLGAYVWFDAACQRLPEYAPAQGHLAEVEAALGEHETSVARLTPFAMSSDDPDYSTQLARILGQNGKADEAAKWRVMASARYDVLMARHPAAFADHAAEFWLTVGGDAKKALSLATMNLAVRDTPRARELVFRAAQASAST